VNVGAKARLMLTEDDELKRELDRLDPRGILGWISLAATLFNIVYSAIVPYYTFDFLISTSFLFGVLACMHDKSPIPRVSLVLLGLHLAIVAILRISS